MFIVLRYVFLVSTRNAIFFKEGIKNPLGGGWEEGLNLLAFSAMNPVFYHCSYYRNVVFVGIEYSVVGV